MFRKQAFLFVAVAVAAFILMSYQSRKGRLVSNPSLETPLNASHSAARSVSDFLLRPFRVLGAREEENRSLRRQLDEVTREKDRFQEVLAENRRLRELLAFRESATNTVAAARVIARGLDNWAHTIVIDKGRRDGVAKDMAVVTPKGLAGKVVEASDGYATVLLMTDINFAAAARLQGSRREGIVAGAGPGRCLLKYVPYEEEVKTGEVIITSGFDSLFPKGIPVGYVSRVDNRGSGGNFQHIEVRPFQDNARMEEVLVVR